MLKVVEPSCLRDGHQLSGNAHVARIIAVRSKGADSGLRTRR